MKLYIQQKVFSLGDRFYVKGEDGIDKYRVEGEILSWGKKLHVYNRDEREIAFIEQEVLTLLPKYRVYVNGAEVAEIVKEFTFLFPKYRIDGLGWEIDGDFMAHDYQIMQGGYPIASIRKEWFTWGDCYEVDITNPENEIVALAVTLAIDCVLAQASSNAAMNS